MLERHDDNCVLDDECEAQPETETIEQDDAATVSDRDYQAGFWSSPN